VRAATPEATLPTSLPDEAGDPGARRLMAQGERLDRDASRRLRVARERLEALGIPHEGAIAFEG
jgi:hypothetical protein